MSDTAQSAGRPGPSSHAFEPPFAFEPWLRGGGRHLPLPVKILAVVAAFWLFHPLGVALLVMFLWRAAQGGGCAFRGGRSRERRGGAFGARGPARPSSRNAAFEARRQETLKALDEEAEAFDAFERGRREAEDRAAFERFVAGRNAARDNPPA